MVAAGSARDDALQGLEVAMTHLAIGRCAEVYASGLAAGIVGRYQIVIVDKV